MSTDSTEEVASLASQPRTRSKRKWLRFSLMFLLIVISVSAILLGRYRQTILDYLAAMKGNDRIVPVAFDVKTNTNILWKAAVGSQSYATPVVSNGKVFIGTNNGAGYLDRYPADIDLGVLLCFDASSGDFLWQASSEKLLTGRKNDWPLIGICSTPYVERDRLWYVTSRGEIVCLDTEGYLDDEDDGIPCEQTISRQFDEADTVWRFDMRKELDVSPHNVSASSVCVGGDAVFAVTGKGLGTDHVNIENSHAPSFVAVHKKTGKLLWKDDSPGKNILHGQWGSPTYAIIKGIPQVIFPGGDGWLYSFDPKGDGKGGGKLLWKFDCNPKDSVWILGGRGTRNNLIAAPTVHNDRVFMTVGQDPEHGEGNGHVWCIDATKRGDISPDVVLSADGKPVPHRRLIAADGSKGEVITPNPNSAVVWHFDWTDMNGDGVRDFEEEMHRSLCKVTIVKDKAFATDFSGIVHALDLATGKQLWTYDLMAACWSTPVISKEHVYVGDEDGDISVFKLDGSPANKLGTPLVSETNVGTSVYPTPVIHKNVLYILARNQLIAVADPNAAK